MCVKTNNVKEADGYRNYKSRRKVISEKHNPLSSQAINSLLKP